MSLSTLPSGTIPLGNRGAESIASRQQHLYERVAERIVHLAKAGTLAPGDRIPSVRECSRQMGVSLSTVKEAYRRLEDAGYVEARPQSGYYLRHLPITAPLSRRSPGVPVHLRRPAEPSPSRPPSDPAQVTIGQLCMEVLRDGSAASGRPGMVALGVADPNREMVPMEKLSRALARVVRDAENERLLSSYDFPPGCQLLREQIARRLVIGGCSMSPAEVVTTAGAQEAVHLCLRATCQSGDTVAIESPIFYGILQAVESLGLRALEVPTHPRTGISLDALEYALSEAKREGIRVGACLIMASHSNPMGSCLSDANKERLVALLEMHGIPLIEDDVYGDLGHEIGRPKTCKAWDRSGNVLLCSSFSKTISPALRVGYAVPGRFQQRVEYLKMVSTLGGSVPPQLAVAELLQGGGYEQHLRRVRRAYQRHTALMSEAIGHYFPEGTRVSAPTGGYVLWVELPQATPAPPLDERDRMIALYQEALAAGVSFAPGFLFSARGNAYTNCLRLNAAHWSPEIERAVETLGRLARHIIA